MNFKTFVMVCKALPADQSVIGRGDHGIGKSQVAYQIAEHFGLQVVERRLSQMSEGDMVGLPYTDGVSTTFRPPDWILDACRNPRLLFLDELNRATPEVMQAAFQIVLDRELMGHKLHPDTRVYAMVNTSAQYNVNSMDPALLDRFYVADLEPTVEDWLDWATTKGNLDPAVTDFVRENPKFLDNAGKSVDPTKVHPSRRSWEKLAKALKKENLFETPANELFFGISIGMVGVDATSMFQDYVKNMDKQVSAEDILNNYKVTRKKIKKLGQERLNICIEKIGEWVEKNTLTNEHAPNIKAFAEDIPGELVVHLWAKLTKHGSKNLVNAKVAHAALTEAILKVHGTNKVESAPAKK